MGQRKLFRTLMERQDKDVTNSKMAEVMGVSDATISNFLNYKNELTLASWILAIRYLAPEKEDQLVGELADDMISYENRLNCRLLMEYASTKRNFPLLEKLIESQMTAPKENKDWAEIYKINFQHQTRVISADEVYTKLNSISPKTHETRVLKSILIAYALYSMKEYKLMFRLGKDIEKDVEKIKNPFIRESYTIRLCELYARGYLYLKADGKKARFYANTVINSRFLCPKFTSHMYHLLGTSFVFESYTESIRYFNLYCKTLKEQGRSDLAEETGKLDIFFVKVLWGQSVAAKETDDSLELLHYYARQGNTEMVTKLREKVDVQDPFAMCYFGIAENNPEKLLMAAAKFLENGNKFFAELPRKELSSHPVFSVSANVVCSINIA